MDDASDIKLQYRLDGTLILRLSCHLGGTLASVFQNLRSCIYTIDANMVLMLFSCYRHN